MRLEDHHAMNVADARRMELQITVGDVAAILRRKAVEAYKRGLLHQEESCGTPHPVTGEQRNAPQGIREYHLGAANAQWGEARRMAELYGALTGIRVSEWEALRRRLREEARSELAPIRRSQPLHENRE